MMASGHSMQSFGHAWLVCCARSPMGFLAKKFNSSQNPSEDKNYRQDECETPLVTLSLLKLLDTTHMLI